MGARRRRLRARQHLGKLPLTRAAQARPAIGPTWHSRDTNSRALRGSRLACSLLPGRSMKDAWLRLVMWGVPLLVGCGGSTAASPGGGGRAGNDQPNEGAAGTLAMPAMPEPQPGGTSGSPGIPPGGHCTKLCVNTASFVFDSALSSAELFSGSLKACHNGAQECHTGTLPPARLGREHDHVPRNEQLGWPDGVVTRWLADHRVQLGQHRLHGAARR